MGYTPLFDTLTKGTLCGRWPDIGLWPVVLSLADRHGVVDCTPAYIAGVTGLPLDDVIACMKRFCEPDVYSRSQEHQGARLELLDAHREWGWQVVNHGKYREKARKAMQQLDATASGRDAERKRIEREKATRDVPTRPAVSGADRPSDSDSDSDSDKDKDKNQETFSLLAAIKLEYPRGLERGDHWILAEKAVGKLLDAGEPPESLVCAAKCYREQQEACETIGSNAILRPHNFFANGAWRGPFPLPKASTKRMKSATEIAEEYETRATQ
jgi:hypothetical protein